MSRRELACTTEQLLEKRVASELTYHGLLTWHNDATRLPGIPDRYVAGGNWIEFKHVNTFATAVKKLDRQRTWMRRLHAANDRVFVCVFLSSQGLLYLEPWPTWLAREAGKFTAHERVQLLDYVTPVVCTAPAHINLRVSETLGWFNRA